MGQDLIPKGVKNCSKISSQKFKVFTKDFPEI